MIRFTSNKSNFYLHQQRTVALKYALKSVGGRVSTPDPTGGAQDDPLDPLVGWGGDIPSPDSTP